MKTWTLLLALAAVSSNAMAGSTCEPLSHYHLNDSVSFNDAPLDRVLKQIVKAPLTVRTIGIPYHKINADGVSGRLDAVLNGLASIVSAKIVQNGCDIQMIGPNSGGFPASSGGNQPPIQARAPEVRQAIISIHNGDSIRSVLTKFAKNNNYKVDWTGDDLFAKKGADFVGSSFEDVINKFFVATRITGYIATDESGVLNVFVQ